MGKQKDMMTSLISGATAGLTCDLCLYPADTVKTRLQSRNGFFKSGGFHGIYRGLGSAALGSIPSASTFFLAYDTSKSLIRNVLPSNHSVHVASGCVGEIFACMVRIPFEVVKQTAQANSGLKTRSAFLHVLSNDGFRGLFSGYISMVFRDIPFTVIQMPIWEYLKSKMVLYTGNEITGFQSGVCGSMAGGIAAALTTPLDVAKTRIILSRRILFSHSENPFLVLYQIGRNEGMLTLFSGITPRVISLSTGGFIFLGAYDFTRIIIHKYYWT